MKTVKIISLFLISLFLLTACQSKWKLDVELTPEERQATLNDIEELKLTIQNYDGEEGTIPHLDIISLARDYEKLGDLKKVEQLYLSYLNQGYKTKNIIHNLGRLYEKVGDYEKAILQYQRLVDEYHDDDYFYDITWAYIRAKNRLMAEKTFNLWQNFKHKTDLQTQEALKKLRAEEKGEE